MYYYRVVAGGSMETQSQSFGGSWTGEVGVEVGDGHAGSTAFATSATEEVLARTLLPSLLGRFPRTLHSTAERLARRLAALRRNQCVCLCQRLWPLRQLVTPEQMVQALLKVKIKSRRITRF